MGLMMLVLFSVLFVSPSSSSGCERKFYVLSLEETEARAPRLSRCSITTYAWRLQTELSASLCATADLHEADVLMVPGYTYTDCHWPHYNHDSCQKEGTYYRSGDKCYDDETMRDYAALRSQKDFDGKILALADSGDGIHGFPDRRLFHDPGFLVMRLGLPAWAHSPNNIALPSGPTPRCASAAGQKAMSEPLSSKKYFLTFKGHLSRNLRRIAAAKLHHNDMDVIIADANDEQYDFDDLLYSSVFGLVMEGDGLFSFRFNEAVCSGAIPVLVSSTQVPPFHDLVPFAAWQN